MPNAEKIVTVRIIIPVLTNDVVMRVAFMTQFSVVLFVRRIVIALI
jgi:hypothetical protein